MAKKKERDEKSNYKIRAYRLELYSDCPEHVKAMEIINSGIYEYACICHDKDVDDDGVIKKAHYHYVLRFPNAKYKNALLKELGIAYNYCLACDDVDGALLYLIHFRDSSKFQYDISEVQGSLKIRLAELLEKYGKGESERVVELFNFLDSVNGFISVREFSRWCAENGYWDIYRRSASIFLKVLDEHNARYSVVDRYDNN